MASTPAHELREKNAEELKSELAKNKQELFKLRFQAATGQLPNNQKLRVIKGNIARIYTVMRERELGLSVVPGAEA